LPNRVSTKNIAFLAGCRSWDRSSSSRAASSCSYYIGDINVNFVIAGIVNYCDWRSSRDIDVFKF
jgi:hypothetical protein